MTILNFVTLKINDFIPRTSDLFFRMIAQGGNRATVFQKIGKTHEEKNKEHLVVEKLRQYS